MFQLFFRVLLLAVFAVWFGGFTFYAAAVVPIGTEVLGSSRTQGFVTQRVTDVLNATGGFAILLMMVDWLTFSRATGHRLKRPQLAAILLLVTTWVLLVLIHPGLDSLLEPEHEHVENEIRFYNLHRFYLWISTVQWLLCWVYLGLLLRGWTTVPPLHPSSES
ncbi:MAG: hypothetical protein VX768_11705 [Planctomycetota bacterium]|nr:hypothetical protein [Planctomycetota bacterium]